MQQSAAPFVEGVGRAKALAPQAAPAGLPAHPLDPMSGPEYEQASCGSGVGGGGGCQAARPRQPARVPPPPFWRQGSDKPLSLAGSSAAQVAQACREHAASLGLDPTVLRFNGVNAQVRGGQAGGASWRGALFAGRKLAPVGRAAGSRSKLGS